MVAKDDERRRARLFLPVNCRDVLAPTGLIPLGIDGVVGSSCHAGVARPTQQVGIRLEPSREAGANIPR